MPPRLYTQEPIECVVEDVGWIPVWVTPRNPSTIVTCVLTPLEGVLTNVPVIAVERPDHPDLIIVYTECSGRMELSSTSTTVFWTIVVSVWRCIMGVIKVTGTLVKSEAKTSMEFTVTRTPKHDNCGVTYTILDKHENQRFYATWTHAITRQLMYITMVANDFSLKNLYKMSINTITKIAHIAPIRIDAASSYLKIFSKHIRIKILTTKLTNTYTKVRTNVLSNIDGISKTISVTAHSITNAATYTANVITHGITDAATYTTNVITRSITNAATYTTNVITHDITNAATYTANVITHSITNAATYTINVITHLLSIVQSHVFRVRMFLMPITVHRVMTGIHMYLAVKINNIKKVLFTSSLKSTKEKRINFSTLTTLIKFKSVRFVTYVQSIKKYLRMDIPQTNSTNSDIAFMPLSTVVDNYSIIIGTRTAYDAYHIAYMRIYMQELSGILARLIFNAQDIREDYTVNVMAYMQDVVTLRLLQWFLHSKYVSNEGYSQEIIYDLGKVPIIGPVPPSSEEIWEGGYVDYPFIGAGYSNTDESTGFKSPAADAWVENVKMFWNSEQKLFEGGGNP